jgi:hypothetical protein
MSMQLQLFAIGTTDWRTEVELSGFLFAQVRHCPTEQAFRQIQQDRARVSSHANHLRLSSNDTDGRWTNRPRHSPWSDVLSQRRWLENPRTDRGRLGRVAHCERNQPRLRDEHRGRAPGRLRFHRSSTKAPDCAGHRFSRCPVTSPHEITYQ